jgi:hypothetical protein
MGRNWPHLVALLSGKQKKYPSRCRVAVNITLIAKQHQRNFLSGFRAINN